MRSSRKSSVISGIIFSLALSFIAPANAANLDDGYPEGAAAPGRTCPNIPEGFEVVSEYSQKTLVCTVINGEQKWWIKGDPLPAPMPTPSMGSNSGSTSNNGGSNNTAPEIQYVPKYKLPASSLSLMKVYENVVYASTSASQRLDIYLPKGIKNPPLIVYTHGGGFVFGDEDFMKYDEPAKLLEVFIKNGLAVASVNYRLAQEAMYPAAGIDTKSAIRFLRASASKYGYDPKKFATGGDSAGSYLALMAAITGNQSSPFDDPADPNRKISAAISLDIDLFGNVDFFEMASNKIKYPCDQSKNPFPETGGNIHPWFGDMTSPTVQASMKAAGLYPYLKNVKVLPAFFIFHGLDDCSVSPYDSRNLDKTVKSLKGTSVLTLVPGAIHGGAGVWAAVMKAVPAIKKALAASKI
ncbi:MAG: alpha/beta hydrolase [Actinomycetes bacterium]